MLVARQRRSRSPRVPLLLLRADAVATTVLPDGLDANTDTCGFFPLDEEILNLFRHDVLVVEDCMNLGHGLSRQHVLKFLDWTHVPVEAFTRNEGI